MRFNFVGSVCIALLSTGLPVCAQEGATAVRPNIGNVDSKAQGTAVRVSHLIGMNIVNSRGQNVGKVHDIVIDGHRGKVQYMAVTYGGFLGLGEKLFAVPYEAFQHRVDPNDRNKHSLVLDVTQQQLEGDQGFDQESWPDFADEKFTRELDRRYRIERRNNEVKRGVDVNIGRDGVEVDVIP